MTASETQNPGRTSGRVALVVIGVCQRPACAGRAREWGCALGIHATQRDGDGFYATGSTR